MQKQEANHSFTFWQKNVDEKFVIIFIFTEILPKYSKMLSSFTSKTHFKK